MADKAQLVRRCRSCAHPNLWPRRFCGRCGDSVVRFCSHCHFSNEFEDRYCGRCSRAIEVDAAEVARDKTTPIKRKARARPTKPPAPTSDLMNQLIQMNSNSVSEARSAGASSDDTGELSQAEIDTMFG